MKEPVAAKISALEKRVNPSEPPRPTPARREAPPSAAPKRAVPMAPIPAELNELVAGLKTSALASVETLALENTPPADQHPSVGKRRRDRALAGRAHGAIPARAE